MIGPAYKDVAKKYENNDKNVKMLAEKIIKGGQGNWGEIPMAGHPNVSQADAEAMVRYILTIK
jgi:cytochrome c